MDVRHAPAPACLAQCDPTGRVDLEDARVVESEIVAILARRMGPIDPGLLSRAIADLSRAYRGEYPGLLRCDTLYHDMRHALETGLTMARLLDGHAQRAAAENLPAIDGRLALLGMVLALYHDIGLLRRPNEADIWGATLTPVHEERGVEFMRGYLAGTPLADLTDLTDLIMPTKLVFKIPPDWSPLRRHLGSLIATADLLSQMADRCYLEKCRDFLFLEFSAIGLAGTSSSPYPDRETLLAKTPAFYTGFIDRRLSEEFGNVRRLIAVHHAGFDPYDAAIRRNLDYLAGILASQDFTRLRRHPKTFVPEGKL